MKNDDLELDSKAISALPIINAFIERIGLRDLLARYLPSKKNLKFPHADAILLFGRLLCQQVRAPWRPVVLMRGTESLCTASIIMMV